LEGTLAAWRNNAKGRADALMEAINKVAMEDTPTQEEADKIFEQLKNEPFGSLESYLGLDLTSFQGWLSANDQKRKDSPGEWVNMVDVRFHKWCQKPINEIYEKLKEIRDELKAYAALSNKTEAGTRTQEHDDADAVNDRDYRDMMEGLHISSPSKPQEELQNFLETPEWIEQWWPPRTQRDVKKVEQFSNFWSKLVRTSKKREAAFFIQPANVEPTVKAILQWEKENSKRNLAQFSDGHCS